MRALLLLLVVVAAFLLVLRFFPSDGVGAEERLASDSAAGAQASPTQQSAGVGARFLTRPEGSGGLYRAEEAPAAAPVTVAAGSADEGAEEVPSWLREIEATPVRGAPRTQVLLAEAVLHGPAADVARVLDDPDVGLSEERALVVLAFKEALDGRRSRALEHAQSLGDEVRWAPGDQGRLRGALVPGEGGAARPSAAREEGPLELAMEMALAQREAEASFQERRFDRAARLYSELILNELEAPWEAHGDALARWSEALNVAQDQHRWSARGTWPSVELVVEAGDSLTTVRKRYVDRYPARLMCTGLIAKANALRGYLQPGQKLRIPTDPVEALVDLSSRRVLLLVGGEVARSYEAGIGRDGQETRTGVFVAGSKQENPTWFPKGREPIPFGDPRNPLGTRWIPWKAGEDVTSYGFHGTNDPTSVGQAASDGCIRLRNADVEELFELLPEGARIVVRA